MLNKFNHKGAIDVFSQWSMQMKIANKIVAISIFILISGCAVPHKPQKVSLELSAIQSREFATTKKVAFASVLSEFQDLGYIIRSADFDAGLITADSPIRKVGNIFYPFFNIEATALIEELKTGHIKIRLNFVNVRSKGLQSIKEKEVVNDAEIYNDAFTEIQEDISSRSATN